MRILKNFFGFELQNGPLIFKLDLVYLSFRDNRAASFPITEDLHFHVLIQHPLLHQVGRGEVMPDGRGGGIDGDGLVDGVGNWGHIFPGYEVNIGNQYILKIGETKRFLGNGQSDLLLSQRIKKRTQRKAKV